VKRMTIRTSSLLVLVLTIIAYIAYAFEIEAIDNGSYNSNSIWAISVLGVVIYAVCIFSWKRLSGKIFDIYVIFITFAFLFNYGQCFMWAFGIHADNEIGVRRLFSLLPVLTTTEIIKTQVTSLIGLLFFHCGAVISYGRKEIIPEREIIQSENENYKRSILYNVCRITIVISSVCAFYEAIRIAVITSVYGYGAELYNAASSSVLFQNNIITLLSYMFFASIVGLLIGSRYNQRTVRTCYLLFALYALLQAISGNRGEWLYPMIFLVWMHNFLKKRIRPRTIIKYFILGFFLLVILVAIRNTRKYGVSLFGLWEAITSEQNPIVSTFMEMGQSMSILGFFIRTGWGIYPYGNTYILAIFGMITEKGIKFFIPSYSNISGWLSQDYMGIKNSGLGFSMIGEAYENFGPYIFVIALFVLGYIYSKIMNTDNIDSETESIKLFFKVTTAQVLISSTRNQMLTSLKMWTFSTGIILLAYLMAKNFMRRRRTH